MVCLNRRLLTCVVVLILSTLSVSTLAERKRQYSDHDIERAERQRAKKQVLVDAYADCMEQAMAHRQAPKAVRAACSR